MHSRTYMSKPLSSRLAHIWKKVFLSYFFLISGQIDLGKVIFIVIWDLKRTCYGISHQRCSIIKGVLRSFLPDSKDLWQSLFLNTIAGLKSSTLLKKSLWHRCFPVTFAKCPRTPFLQNTSGWLLLLLTC